MIKIRKKEYERISIAFKDSERSLLTGLKKLAEKNRRSVGAELKLLIEEKLNRTKLQTNDSKDSFVSENTFFEED